MKEFFCSSYWPLGNTMLHMHAFTQSTSSHAMACGCLMLQLAVTSNVSDRYTIVIRLLSWLLCSVRPSEVQKTSVKRNDSTPRWIETFDFVMVSAGSMLTLNIWSKVSLVDAVASLKLSAVGLLLGRCSKPGLYISHSYIS